MAKYAKIAPGDDIIEVDLDPAFADTVTDAYLSVLLYIPSSVKPDLAANPSNIANFITGDNFGLGIHAHAGLFDWYGGTGAGTNFAPVTFDALTQIEVHAVAGDSAYDIRIDGTLYTNVGTFAFLPATGVNYWSLGSLPVSFIGDGGGSAADDTFFADELSWSLSNWVSIGGADARWAFESADPLNDAQANYPTPPWFYFPSGDNNITVETGGGSEVDLEPGGNGGPGDPPDPVGCCADAGELEARVFIGGTEVTGVCVSGSWTPRLNRPAQASVTVPMDAAIGNVGDLLRIELGNATDTCIVFHGRILNLEVDTAKDEGRVVYNAQDAMELWQWRVVRDNDGDFSKPRVIEQYITGPQIMQAVLINTVDSTGRTSLDLFGGGPPPVKAEGPIGLDLGNFAIGGVNLKGAPVDWPMKISELFSLLASTGEVDGVISYTNPGGGVTGRVDFYNGNYGTDRSATVGFEYGTGLFNAAEVRWNRDMTNVINKYQIFGGPQIQTASDPKGEQHWCFNVTGDDPGLARPPGGDVAAPYTGGDAPGSAGNPLGQRRLDSQAAYDVRMQIDIFDAFDDNCVPHFGTKGRNLYRFQWQTFSWLSAMPRELIHITPVAGTEIGCFGIGDLIHVEAVSDVLGGFSGSQRVYEYTVSWDATPSVLTLSEIQTSSDNEQ